MQISSELASLFNQQVSNEQANAHLYEQVACWCRLRGLKNLAAMFAKQADEERGHHKKMLGYLEEVNAEVVIPPTEAKPHGWGSCNEVAQTFIEAEMQTTEAINEMMRLAMSEEDYSAQDFLQPFCQEQSEEVTTAQRFMAAVMASGGNLLLLDHWAEED